MDTLNENGFQFLSDEDADEIITRYVELSALHYRNPANFTPYAIAFQVFSELKLRDPYSRSLAAAKAWMFDLSILDKISLQISLGDIKKHDTSKDAVLAGLFTIFNDHHAAKRDRIESAKQICKIQGYDAPTKQEVMTNAPSDMLANMAKLLQAQ